MQSLNLGTIGYFGWVIINNTLFPPFSTHKVLQWFSPNQCSFCLKFNVDRCDMKMCYGMQIWLITGLCGFFGICMNLWGSEMVYPMLDQWFFHVYDEGYDFRPCVVSPFIVVVYCGQCHVWLSTCNSDQLISLIHSDPCCSGFRRWILSSIHTRVRYRCPGHWKGPSSCRSSWAISRPHTCTQTRRASGDCKRHWQEIWDEHAWSFCIILFFPHLPGEGY